MSKHPLPNVPYVEARHHGEKQRPTAIAIDLSMTTSEKGSALGIAKNLHSRTAPANSYHYIVDEFNIYQGVWTDLAAHKAPYRSVNILLCAQPTEKMNVWFTPSRNVLKRRCAGLVADLCLSYKIKPRYIFNEDLEKWTKHRWRRNGGIIVRVPGEWPTAAFLVDVKSQMLLKQD